MLLRSQFHKPIFSYYSLFQVKYVITYTKSKLVFACGVHIIKVLLYVMHCSSDQQLLQVRPPVPRVPLVPVVRQVRPLVRRQVQRQARPLVRRRAQPPAPRLPLPRRAQLRVQPQKREWFCISTFVF